MRFLSEFHPATVITSIPSNPLRLRRLGRRVIAIEILGSDFVRSGTSVLPDLKMFIIQVNLDRLVLDLKTCQFLEVTILKIAGVDWQHSLIKILHPIVQLMLQLHFSLGVLAEHVGVVALIKLTITLMHSRRLILRSSLYNWLDLPR